MKKKKIIWIGILFLAFIGIGLFAFFLDSNSKNISNSLDNTTFNKESNANNTADNNEDNSVANNTNNDNKKEYIKTELDDGTLYSIDGQQYIADMVIGDNYFDTTINDMFYNPDSYKNKKIEVEGMYLQNLPYTFVGRYSTSNLCAYCPVGYSYIEYELDGKLDKKLIEEQDWIKIIGTLEVGNDASSNFQNYYYLKVLSLEVMKEKGQDTVNN